VSSSDWWASKLGNQAPPRPQPQLTYPTPQQQVAPMPQFQQPQNKIPQSARQNSTCPDCGSSNFMAAQNSAPRCFDCGYPMEQSGSKYGSLTGAKVEGSIKPSLGNDATNSYQPQNIVSRIG
jgi:ribosomal protein S27AE